MQKKIFGQNKKTIQDKESQPNNKRQLPQSN